MYHFFIYGFNLIYREFALLRSFYVTLSIYDPSTQVYVQQTINRKENFRYDLTYSAIHSKMWVEWLYNFQQHLWVVSSSSYSTNEYIKRKLLSMCVNLFSYSILDVSTYNIEKNRFLDSSCYMMFSVDVSFNKLINLNLTNTDLCFS